MNNYVEKMMTDLGIKYGDPFNLKYQRENGSLTDIVEPSIVTEFHLEKVEAGFIKLKCNDKRIGTLDLALYLSRIFTGEYVVVPIVKELTRKELFKNDVHQAIKEGHSFYYQVYRAGITCEDGNIVIFPFSDLDFVLYICRSYDDNLKSITDKGIHIIKWGIIKYDSVNSILNKISE